MSRKDYVAIASVLRTERETFGSSDACDRIARGIAGVLASDSPRFDRGRFYAACGVEV